MNWSKKLPSQPGWYWHKSIEPPHWLGNDAQINYVRIYAGELCIFNSKIPDNHYWAGPIPEPELKPEPEGE